MYSPTYRWMQGEPATSRQFLPMHYQDPIPLQQIQLTSGKLTQNPGW